MTPSVQTLDIVPVNDLASRLGFAEPLNYPLASRQKPLTDFKMEVDDSPIFRYLYRNFRPTRHLEFGTWQGSGVLYCLEECAATVWTLNLPQGERNDDGTRSYQEDDGASIGRFYREKDLGNRVCQIYCNSLHWDISNYPKGFFDSALIDGGHTPEVVQSDTAKALALLRPSGLCLWHDFCPDPAVLKDSATSRGVVEAILEDWEGLHSHMRDLFWIRPSYILAGIVK
jgi:hypothetical protein